MKVLIISAEVWQDGTNGGNVLSNIFTGMNVEFAQIYCNPGTPQNSLCTHYYQITDRMIIKNTFSHKPVGFEFDLDIESKDRITSNPDQPNKKALAFFHKYRLGIFYAGRHFLWNISNWKNEKLNQFICDFDPDVVFAPSYGDIFMLRLIRYVADITGKHVISYISDDSYTLRQFSLSPYFWINRFCVRSQLRKTFPYYDLVYTMTDEQKRQCEKDFHANMKILKKSANNMLPVKDLPENPIKLIYAGGIYLNRWKTLARAVEQFRKMNQPEKKFELHIYTGNEITPAINKTLNNGYDSYIHKSISQDELWKKYKESDVALHVESFDLKNRLLVRMSFSTKIVDCLSSGCAVMAICDNKQAGLRYLREEDAALCASSDDEISELFKRISAAPHLLVEYANKARICCLKNHDSAKIHKMVKEDFQHFL